MEASTFSIRDKLLANFFPYRLVYDSLGQFLPKPNYQKNFTDRPLFFRTSNFCLPTQLTQEMFKMKFYPPLSIAEAKCIEKTRENTKILIFFKKIKK